MSVTRRESILRRNPYRDRRSFVARVMGLSPIGDIAGATLTESVSTSTLTWETASDWDSAASESGVVHEAVTNTDHSDDTIVKQGYSAATPYKASNLVAYLPLHEDSGSAANDLTGNGNDGSLVGSATLGATGILGTTAWDFAASGHIDITDPATDLTQFTVAFWVKMPSGAANDYAVFASKMGDENQNFGAPFDLRTGNGGFPKSYDPQLGDGSTNSLSTNVAGAFSQDTWHYVITSYDGTDGADAYIDGSNVWNGGTGSMSDDQNKIQINQRLDGLGENYMTVADMRFYDVKLTPTESQTLFDVVDTPGTLTSATKSFGSVSTPNLQNLSYTLNGVTDIQLDVIGSPGTASEEVNTVQLAGSTSYSITWSSGHTDFRVKIYPDNEGVVTRTPTVNRVELVA